MSDYMKIIVTLMLVLVSTVLLRVINLKKERRGRQILAVYLSPVLAILGAAYAYLHFSELAFEEGSAFYGAEVLVWNVMIVGHYLAIKAFLCVIMNKVWAKENMMQFSSDTWYEFDDDNNAWFLKVRYKNMQEVFKILVLVAAFISVVVLGMGWIAGAGSIVWMKVFPVVALIVLAECTNFLSGYTKPEFYHDIGGDNITANRMGGFYKLRKIYEELFPESMLTSHTGNEYAGKKGATDLLHKMSMSMDMVDQNVANYFTHLKKEAGFFDVDLIHAVSKLMHGRSVVIFNPFYRDLGDYVLLPMIDSLLNNRKCLIIAGRTSLKNDVLLWAREILKNYSKTRNLWRVELLDGKKTDCEVGVLSFAQIYDASVLNTNDEFLADVEFVLMIEPSKMLTTSQPGLGIIVEKLNRGKKPTYCICDHDMDGLIDTLSHVLQTNMTDVVAAPVPRSVYTAMGWASTGDYFRQRLFGKQTHYLGNGIELAAVALKNQVPHVTWYSEEKAPVKDIKWLAGQYYPQICKYAHLPSHQGSLDERLSFSSNLWESKVKDQEFVIAEDEFCNLFATMRAFLTRGEEQCFVNVISENYLLRDYMRYNRQLFMSDAKAVPAITSHYAKTERNTVLRLILMMAGRPVEEAYIAHELSILGYETDDVYKTLTKLIYKYTFVSDTIVTVHRVQNFEEDFQPKEKCEYYIAKHIFEENFANTLKNAFYVVENEKFGSEYIDAKLFEHITQTVMPGQFIVHDGKYYKVKTVSPQLGCILYRASDSYTERKYYRQLRNYHFEEEKTILETRKVMDIGITLECRSFSVDTSGYLEMRDNHDLRTARVIDLSEDPVIGVYDRSYKDKTVLCISLPETDERMRFTISMLMNELFRSLFPDAWPYLAVLCHRPEDVDGMLDKFNYRVDGAVDEDKIYVVEDSDMDLGLVEAVENNLMRIFEILADYLDWHFEKMRESAKADPILPSVILPPEEEKNSFLSRLLKRIRSIFAKEDGLEQTEATAEETVTAEELADAAGDAAEEDVQTEEEAQTEEETQTEEEPAEEVDPFRDSEEEQPEQDLLENEDETVTLSEDFELHQEEVAEEEAQAEAPVYSVEECETPEEEELLYSGDDSLFGMESLPDGLDLEMPVPQSRYQKECFLKFGFDEVDEQLAVEEVKNYLKLRGWSNNALTKARKRTGLEDTILDLRAENQCDFCGLPLTGVSFERLADGRVRCPECSLTAINNVKEFRELFRRTEIMMSNVFDIVVKVPVLVRVTDARTIARHVGMVFKPSTKLTPRVLGFAQRKGKKYSLFLENGSPRLATIDTTVHEMTHIWQYLNWNDARIRSIYKMDTKKKSGLARDLVYEGMAVWASIQLLYAMGETSYAQQMEALTEARKDVYGLGFCLYRDRYDLVKNGEAPSFSPFTSFPPLDPEVLRELLEGVE